MSSVFKSSLVATLTLAQLFFAAAVLADVQLEGLPDEFESNVRAHVRLNGEACDADRERVEYRFSQAGRQIHDALKPFGFYDAEIESELRFPSDGCWEAVFRIDPGDPILFGEIHVVVQGEASTLDPFAVIPASTTMQPGQPLRHSAYEATKNQLLVQAREYGFLDAKLLKNELRIDLDTGRADVALILESGNRYRFGDIHILGDVLNESFLLRYVEFDLDEPFEQRHLRALHNDLTRGDYFSSVDVRIEPRDGHVADIIVTLEEGRRIRYGVGAGFGTDTGVIVRGDAVIRRLNRFGHRLELDTELSKVRQNATFDYRIPGKRPQSDWYSVYGGISREDTDAIESIAWKTGVRENRYHTENWSSTPFVELVIEEFLQDGEWSRKHSLVPGWGITYVTAKLAPRPTQGLRLRTELAGASKHVLSDASFIRFHMHGKTIFPVTERARVLLRGEAGWMATNDFDTVPPAWRFFAGGDRSVRGFDYKSLGPLDSEGKAIGGRKVITGSIEGDWRFRERWSGAVFADAGNVGEEDLFTDVPWSLGFGVRWYSPVGPIRLDFAFPQRGGNDFRIHISMGPDL